MLPVTGAKDSTENNDKTELQPHRDLCFQNATLAFHLTGVAAGAVVSHLPITPSVTPYVQPLTIEPEMSVSEAPAVDSQVASPAATCPRCHTTKSWGESSWCPDCGYYPIVDKGAVGGASWADDLPATVEEVNDNRTALESIPMWFWGMIAGMIGITGFSVAIRLLFPGEDGESVRGAVALLQLSIGGTSVLVAHIIATKFAMSNDRRINLFDFVIAWFAIWHPTIAALPKTCMRLLAVVWGGIAVITAVTIVGGIDYAAAFRPAHEAPDLKPMKLIGAVAGAAKAQAASKGDKPESMADALNEVASEVDEMSGNVDDSGGSGMTMQEAFDELGDMESELGALTGDLNADLGVNGDVSDLSPEELEAKLREAAEKDRQDVSCFVYGVTIDQRKVPKTFLFAADLNGQHQHVAEIQGVDMNRADYKKLVLRLYKAIQKTPEIPSERKAVWVKPIVTCRLSYAQLTDEAEMDDPRFEAFVVEQRGRFDETK